MLKINHLFVSIEKKEIIKNFSLEINPKELHVLMGPNGSGKSTLGFTLMGHPDYLLNEKSKIVLDGVNITNLNPEERAKIGLFLAFQNPIAVPGVRVVNFLRMAYNQKFKKLNPDTKNSGELGPLEFYQLLLKNAQLLGIPEDFLSRNLNDQFSGGEKKKMEMLAAIILQPKYSILDEPDTGTDIDALKVIAKGVKILQKQGSGVILITHYQRLLKYLKPDEVHVLKEGRLVTSGNNNLIMEIEKEGYQSFN